MAKKVFPARLDVLVDAIAFVEETLEGVACPLKTVLQITVCVEEMFVNVANYAYEGREGEVTLSVDAESGKAIITLQDSGVPFDPLLKDDPDISLSAEDRAIGGLGIFMVKNSMDEVKYERKDGMNVFTMVKVF